MRQNYLAAQRNYSRIWSNWPQCWDTKRGSRRTLLPTVTAIVAIKIVVSAGHINELYLNFISVLVVIERLRLIGLSIHILLVLIVDSEKFIVYIALVAFERHIRASIFRSQYLSFAWCHSPRNDFHPWLFRDAGPELRRGSCVLSTMQMSHHICISTPTLRAPNQFTPSWLILTWLFV